jgi:glucose uptake protein
VILPTTHPAVLLLLVFALLCLGSWANTQKLSGKWRFEFFYFDYVVGVVLCALVAAFTLGSINSEELTFQDNLLIASRHAMAYGLGAGVVFNLANMLLLGAMQVSGMAVAFPIAFGVALVIGAVSAYVLNPMNNMVLLFSGATLTVIAVVTMAVAHVANRDPVTRSPLPRVPRSQRPPSPARGIVLSVVSGILISLSLPLSAVTTLGDTGLSSYSAALFFAGGMLLSTFIYTPFFLTFPVQGAPLQLSDYVAGTKRQHLWGLLGGIVWMAGALAAYAAAAGPAAGHPGAQPNPAVTYALREAAPLAAALWGVLVWREFPGATIRVKMLLLATLVLYAAGIAVVAVAPLFPKQ